MFLTIRSSSDKTPLEFHELGQFGIAQFVTLAAGFSAGKNITSENMKIQVLQFITRIVCLMHTSRHGLVFLELESFSAPL
jgi:hypothetical protein